MDRKSSIPLAELPKRAPFVVASMIGFALGVAVPGGLGIYAYACILAYQSTLPKGPNLAGCGMAQLAALLLIFGVAPTCGMCGAGVLAGICWWRNRPLTPRR